MRKAASILISLLIVFTFVIMAFSQEIHEAVVKGDIKKVKEIVKKNPDSVTMFNKDNITPLHYASQHGYKEIAEFLISMGASLTAVDNNKEIPLHFAAQHGKTEIVKLLLDKGSKTDIKNINGRLPLHLAVLFADIEIVSLLIEHGSNINEVNNEGRTPLYDAMAEPKRNEIVAMLIANGANVNIKDNNGVSPIITAAERGRKEIIELLIKSGANVNDQDNKGIAPLFHSAFFGENDIIEILVSNNADVNIKDNEGNSALFRPIYFNKLQTLKFLVDKGAKWNIKNKYGQTLLHQAAIFGDIEMVRYLLDKGIDINSVDQQGFSALYFAGKYGHKNIADLLVTKGATAKNIEENYNNSQYLNKKLKQGEAFIWYLYDFGVAVKTESSLLIFDYFRPSWDLKVENPCLANGRIDPQEIKHLNVYVFVSCKRQHNYSRIIFTWEKDVDNITYVFSWKAKEGPNYMVMDQNERKIGDLEIFSIKGNDSAAYLVKVDGLSIFHSGDRYLAKSGGKYIDNGLDYLSENVEKTDIVFQSHSGSYKNDIAYYTIDKLNPNVFFPITVSYVWQFHWKIFINEAKKIKSTTNYHYAEYRGDRFFYSKGKIRK